LEGRESGDSTAGAGANAREGAAINVSTVVYQEYTANTTIAVITANTMRPFISAKMRMRFFVFFLICQEMSEAIIALATSAVTTFMDGKQLNTETVLRAGMTLAKQIPGAENAGIICKILDTLLTEALAKVGESNGTEAKILGECKKCVETVLPVVLSLLAQEPGAGAGLAASASAAVAPVVAQVEAAAVAAQAMATAAGIPAPVVAEAQKALANVLKNSSFFGLSCIGCAALPVEVPAAVAVVAAPAAAAAAAPAAAAAAAAAAPAAATAEPVAVSKENTPQTPLKESESQATAAVPPVAPAEAPAAPEAPAAAVPAADAPQS
jgi:hypothetical protein